MKSFDNIRRYIILFILIAVSQTVTFKDEVRHRLFKTNNTLSFNTYEIIATTTLLVITFFFLDLLVTNGVI